MKTYLPHRLTTFVGLAITTWTGACTSGAKAPPPPRPAIMVKTAPATPIQKKRQVTGGPTWNPHWDAVIEKAIPEPMLSHKVPRDVRRFCPRFYKMNASNQRQFWAYFFQALAGAESGLNKVSNVQHLEPSVNVRDSVTGKMTHQEGLLQLSYKDSERYGCRFDWEADRDLSKHDPGKTILQPMNNLICGIKILYRQIIESGKPILYKSSYWSTLRPGTAGYYHFLKQMENAPEACRAPLEEKPLPEKEFAKAKKDKIATQDKKPNSTPVIKGIGIPPETARTKYPAQSGGQGMSRIPSDTIR